MRHAIPVQQLAQVIGYAHQMSVAFKPAKVKGFMELQSWPKDKTAQEIKDYFKEVLNVPFQLVG